MFRNMSNTQLMVLFLGSKSLIENHTEFHFCDHDQNHHEIFQTAMDAHSKEQPEIFTHISSISKVLKERRFTRFKGWYDFSEWDNFNRFVIKMYENTAVMHSFSTN